MTNTPETTTDLYNFTDRDGREWLMQPKLNDNSFLKCGECGYETLWRKSK